MGTFMGEEKEYEVLDEGNEIIACLFRRYKEFFKYANPEKVVVLAVVNVPRPFSMRKLAKITKVDSAHRTLLKRYGRRDVRYLIELYATDWVQWSPPRRQWILAHEIGHIGKPDSKSLVQHSVEDHAWLIDALGIEWWEKDNLPNLLEGEPFPFRLDLFYHLHENDEDGAGIPEGGDSHGGSRFEFQ